MGFPSFDHIAHSRDINFSLILKSTDAGDNFLIAKALNWYQQGSNASSCALDFFFFNL